MIRKRTDFKPSGYAMKFYHEVIVSCLLLVSTLVSLRETFLSSYNRNA